MQRLHPLPRTSPEFSVFRSQTFTELRVENWHLARDGSGKVVYGSSHLSWRDSVLSLVISWIWLEASLWARVIVTFIVALLLWFKCTQILYESVLVLPRHGIQLETHRGFPPWTLTISRRFIPRAALRDVVINEGIMRWNIRYYLVAITQTTLDDADLNVLFPNLLPRFPVLREAYREIHALLLRPAEALDA
ncbi:phosphatidylinositol n-acetylglucosaminyltransferase [Moniliophthora roreri MCA 2997]|uniref:Phosphatidylinositol n-acetylglucosaminyltransferase n=2 Tax=Moniliophthora roreri TaxID=221103 RepID=V2Z0M9_MONRO|nr:phosphatidylinositol n-acetylglucosaminyltransferase [Moniliophthora roreri MCA 2997]